MDKTGQDAMQDKDENQPGEMEEEFPSKKMDPTGNEEDRQGGPFSEPHATEHSREGHAQVALHQVRSFREAPKGPGRYMYGHTGPRD
eukprot:9198187-Heterocapsa_arctica.AAC.1